MRQAITTKYIGPSNVKGSRVKASCRAGSLTLHWDDSLNWNDNQMTAAKALADKLGWDGEWLGGVTQDGHGVFTQLGEDNAFCVEKKAA